MDQLETEKLLDRIDLLATTYRRADFLEQSAEIGITEAALAILDQAEPLIPYTNFLCLPEIIMADPCLVFYYHNVAMVPHQTMKNIGLNVGAIEESAGLSVDRATDIASFMNRIACALIVATGVSKYRHRELFFGNLGMSKTARSDG